MTRIVAGQFSRVAPAHIAGAREENAAPEYSIIGFDDGEWSPCRLVEAQFRRYQASLGHRHAGAVLGRMIEVSGGGEALARALVRLLGVNQVSWALLIA